MKRRWHGAYVEGHYAAAQLRLDPLEQPKFEEFPTLPACDRILADEGKAAA